MPRLRLKDMADPFSLTMTRAAVLARCSINAMHRSPMTRLCTALRVSLMRDYDLWHPDCLETSHGHLASPEPR